ncbi:MAG: hypothetical protein NW217_01930 [Hyphomicrobiaceae bacterium]|nr:hypothetical protein [Hyphomicrobiaceae bacterium]
MQHAAQVTPQRRIDQPHRLCVVSFQPPGRKPARITINAGEADDISVVMVLENDKFGQAVAEKLAAADPDTALAEAGAPRALSVCAEVGQQRAAALSAALRTVAADSFLVVIGAVELSATAVAAAVARHRKADAPLLQIDMAASGTYGTSYCFADYLRYRTYMGASPAPAPSMPATLSHLLLSKPAMMAVADALSLAPVATHWQQLIFLGLLDSHGPPAVSPLLIGQLKTSRDRGMTRKRSGSIPTAHLVFEDALKRLARSSSEDARYRLALAALDSPFCAADLAASGTLSPQASEDAGRARDALRHFADKKRAELGSCVDMAVAIADHMQVRGLASLEISWTRFVHILSYRLHAHLIFDEEALLTNDLEPLLARLDWMILPDDEAIEDELKELSLERAALLLSSLERAFGSRQRRLAILCTPNKVDDQYASDFARMVAIGAEMGVSQRRLLRRADDAEERVQELRLALAEARAQLNNPGRVAFVIADALKNPGWSTVKLPYRLARLAYWRLRDRKR